MSKDLLIFYVGSIRKIQIVKKFVLDIMPL